jgi:hypothetical protein
LTTLLLDGYNSFEVEDGSKTHIIDLAEKAGKREVALFLRSIPEFQERLEKLFSGVKSGDLDLVRELTLTDKRLAVAVGQNGKTALHMGVNNQNMEFQKYKTTFPIFFRSFLNIFQL